MVHVAGGAARARVFGLASVALWATAASAFELTLRSTGPYQAVLAASVVSAVFLAVVCFSRGCRPRFRDVLDALPRGVVNPFAYYLVLLEAYDRLPGQVAMVINYLWPIVLVFMSAAAFGKRVAPRSIVASVMSFSGVVVLAVGNGALTGGLDAAGLLLALASTVLWAAYWVLSMKGAGDQVMRLCLNFAWGVAFLLAFGILTGRDLLPGLPALAGAAWIGLFEMGLTYVLWLRALTLAENTAQVGNLVFITPFLSLVFIGLVVGEPVQAATMAGLVLVVAGLVIQGPG